ncbi:MAG: phage tail protein [Polyangiaceae bacterium]|nr:phage tail protein [Polyangiaceae bacterium]
MVEIDSIASSGFQKCSELSVEVANVQYFEGGSLIPNKEPGRLTFSDVTLKRGATQDRDLFDWFQDVAIMSRGLGLVGVAYKRNLDIVQQDRDGTTLRRWSLSRAWPTKFVAGEWDNDSDENVIESVTLTYDYFDLGTSRERRASEARQTVQSGDVSREGRSLRSSPSAGEPRTWRREAVDEYGAEAAGESHVCGIQLRQGLAPERAEEAVRAKL